MKIIVMSDSHNSFFSLNKIFFNYHADLYIHLGDGERELNQIALTYPEKQIIHIKGNCDLMSLSEDELLFCPYGKYTVFAVHGHKYGVKRSLETLKASTLATPSRAMSDILTLEIDEVSLRFSMRW